MMNVHNLKHCARGALGAAAVNVASLQQVSRHLFGNNETSPSHGKSVQFRKFRVLIYNERRKNL